LLLRKKLMRGDGEFFETELDAGKYKRPNRQKSLLEEPVKTFIMYKNTAVENTDSNSQSAFHNRRPRCCWVSAIAKPSWRGNSRLCPANLEVRAHSRDGVGVGGPLL
jgi:hypothetical protein